MPVISMFFGIINSTMLLIFMQNTRARLLYFRSKKANSHWKDKSADEIGIYNKILEDRRK